MIACGHCGGRHATVAEVRGCSGASSAARATAPARHDDGPDEFRGLDRPAPSADQPSVTTARVVLGAPWEHLAGPDGLARNLIINPGDPIPGPWAEAERIEVIDDRSLERLRQLRLERRRAVIELGTPLPASAPVLDVDYWQLSPDTDLPGEALRHLVVSHAVDARDRSAPTIAMVDLAVAAGASVATDGVGDVTGPDGPRWCDGGPLDWTVTDDGVAVVPAANLRIGSLRPIGDATPQAALAPDQLAAVAHGGAGARIIAPAGSGKTRVLTERARHLIHDRGIDPRAVCLLAFNVRARAEMQERTTDLPGLEIRTLNSLALAIVAGRAPFVRPASPRGSEVIDEHRVRRLLDDLVSGRRRAMADPMAVYLEALTATRLGLRAPEAVEREFGGDVRDFPSVVAGYRGQLRQRGLLDFDEQIVQAIEVLCTDPVARAAARRSAQVVLVDEFQDLTPAHVLLVRLLAGPDATVFGVGDDDQTIYGYAGASPSWLIDFADLFPGAGAHDLTVNYRCAPAVIDGARTLLGHNRRRIDKVIDPAPGRTHQPDGLRVIDASDPSAAAVSTVQGLVGDGVDPSDIALLTRVNATLLGPMLGLDAIGVPTTAPIDPRFLDRTGVAGVLAWLRLATAPAKRLPSADLETAIRRPPRGLRGRLIEWVGEKRSIPELLDLASRLSDARDQAKVADFATDLARLRDLADGADADTTALLLAIRDDIGLGAALDTRLDASRRSVDRSAHGDDLAALLAVAPLEPDPDRFPAWLADRLDQRHPDPDGVQLSTIHRVKGREWPHVVVHDATAGLFPHRLAADIEEERRVFHVAITRSAIQTTVVAGRPASPFVAQLHTERDPNAPDLEPSPRPRASSSAPPAPANSPLRERLRAWRSETAQSAGVPAYVVFNDATLDHLVAARPLDEDGLLDITGIGPVKVERHGGDILAIIESFVDD
ncbi:MAG: ATP-dependent DNA helicase UvrD2 [Actinomycetota bacterium]